MSTSRRLAAALTAALALATPYAAAGAPARPAGGLPVHATVKDSRTSSPDVDISQVEISASWYWASVHDVLVTVPGGFRAGQHLTIYYDIDGDAEPEGRYDLTTKARPGKKLLQLSQTLRKGGGWGLSGKKLPARWCSDEDDLPAYYLKAGDRSVQVAFDVFGCFGQHPTGDDPGAWRVAVRLAKGGHSDMAPSGRRWSPAVRGWEPCDPSGGDCD